MRSEVLRQDALLKDRDAALDRQTAHVHHLEALIAERERDHRRASDGQLAALDAARQQREQLIALRDRELAERDRMLADARCDRDAATFSRRPKRWSASAGGRTMR